MLHDIIATYERKNDALDEALLEVEGRIDDLRQAQRELEEAKGRVEAALDALNDLDDIDASVSIDDYSFDLSDIG